MYNKPDNNSGATYLMVLMVVMVIGIMLGITGQSWKQVMQREKEEELLFRGTQIRDALNRWHNPRQGQTAATPLNDLSHLLKDPRAAGSVKHLRRLYNDPVTNSEWKLIKDPVRGIIGVSSSSDLKPIKQGNFPLEMATFAGKQKYSDWQFVTTSSDLQSNQQAGTRDAPSPTPQTKTPLR